MITRGFSLYVLMMAIGLSFAGCAAFNGAPPEDSAIVSNSLPFFHPGEQAIVFRIDGSSPGIHLGALHLSPGEHALTVSTNYLADPDDDSLSWTNTVITAVFAANHRYIVQKSTDDVMLFDETAGEANPNPVGRWKITGEVYSDSEPITQVDFGSAVHIRPPLDRGEHPAHSAGPPSIPHNPRPSPRNGPRNGPHNGGNGHKR